jgi:putative transposase
MPQSLYKNYIHVVINTKYRQPYINEKVENSLYGYLAGICNNLQCTPIKIGGHLNHVHILCLLSKGICLSEFVSKLKSNSSRWMKEQDLSTKDFRWSDGYGAFSVNPNDIEIVKKYIENQKEHHRKKTFQEEYLELLEKFKVPYDERYLWD